MNNLITQSTTAGPWIDINTNYLLTSAYLVFFMHCGFAMVRPPHTIVLSDLQSYHLGIAMHSKLSALNTAKVIKRAA